MGEVIQIGSDDATHAAVGVAEDAALLHEELPARFGIAGRVEVVEGEEEPDQVRRLPLIQSWAVDAELLHPCRHALQVVPHVGGEIIEGVGPRDAREIGSDLAADAVYRVTLGAALGAEDLGAGQRILAAREDGLGECRADGQVDQREHEESGHHSLRNQPDRHDHGHAHQRPFLQHGASARSRTWMSLRRRHPTPHPRRDTMMHPTYVCRRGAGGWA